MDQTHGIRSLLREHLLFTLSRVRRPRHRRHLLAGRRTIRRGAVGVLAGVLVYFAVARLQAPKWGRGVCC